MEGKMSRSEEKDRCIRIGINRSDEVRAAPLRNLLDSMIESFEIFEKFQVEIVMDPEKAERESCNHLFFLMTDKDIGNLTLLEDWTETIDCPRQHLFVVLDSLKEMVLDSDNELVFSDKAFNKSVLAFDKKLGTYFSDKAYHFITMTIKGAGIWSHVVDNDGSIKELSDRHINHLVEELVPNSSDLGIADKRRDLRVAIKGLGKKMVRRLMMTGYSLLETEFARYFSISQQKNLVNLNYLRTIRQIDYSRVGESLRLLKEIADIDYLKEEVRENFFRQIDKILLEKAKHHRATVSVSPIKGGRRPPPVDLSQASSRKSQIQEILGVISGNFEKLQEDLEAELQIVSATITQQRCKEVENLTDLTKVGDYLESLTGSEGASEFLAKMPDQTKIIQENLQSTVEWISFLVRCQEMGVGKEDLINLVKNIIIAKIEYYKDSTNTTQSDLSMTYPQCLNVFLISHLEKDFVFKHLQMILTYSIRFSGRNLSDLIRRMTEKDYQTILGLEHFLLSLFG